MYINLPLPPLDSGFSWRAHNGELRPWHNQVQGYAGEGGIPFPSLLGGWDWRPEERHGGVLPHHSAFGWYYEQLDDGPKERVLPDIRQPTPLPYVYPVFRPGAAVVSRGKVRPASASTFKLLLPRSMGGHVITPAFLPYPTGIMPPERNAAALRVRLSPTAVRCDGDYGCAECLSPDETIQHEGIRFSCWYDPDSIPQLGCTACISLQKNCSHWHTPPVLDNVRPYAPPRRRA